MMATIIGNWHAVKPHRESRKVYYSHHYCRRLDPSPVIELTLLEKKRGKFNQTQLLNTKKWEERQDNLK